MGGKVAKPRAANADGGADDAAGMPLAAVDPQKGHGGAATGAVSPQALQESGRRAAAQPGAAAPSSAGTGRQLADSPLSAGAGTSPDKPQRPARSILKTQPLTTRQRARGSGVRPGGRSGSGSSSEGGSSSESGRSSRADGVLDRILEGADRALQTCFAGLQGAALDAAIRKAFDSAVPEIGGNLDRPAFGEALSAMGVQLSSEEMTILFDEFDTSGDKAVEFREFNTMVRECLAGSDVDSESSHSTTSYSGSSVGSSLKSMFSSDSQALRKHPLILQVQVKEGKVPGKPPPEGFFPYLVLTYGDMSRSVSTVRRTATPSWNENFVFKVPDITTDVFVKCHHWDGRGQGPGPLLGMATIKTSNLIAGFEGSESTSDLSSSNDTSSVSGRARYLGQPGAPSPKKADSQVSQAQSGSKRTPSPGGESPLRSGVLTGGIPTGGLPSAINSTPGRGAQRRAAMKQKGRVHKHGRFKVQESQKWYPFTDLDGKRLTGGFGIRIRLRPWAPKGMQKELRVKEMQEEQNPAGGIRSLFNFGRQPKKEESESESSSGSSSSLSTLAESEDDMGYSSPDEIEMEVAPHWSRKPAHVPHPNQMTGIYRNLFGDQTLEEQLKHLKQKQKVIHREEENLKTNQVLHLLRDGQLEEQKLEVAMMMTVVQKRLRQSMSVNEMPLEKGWEWEPRKRRYAASGAICENELADGFGLRPFGHETESEEEDEEDAEKEGVGTAEQHDESGVIDDRPLTAESEIANAPYVHAGDVTPLHDARTGALNRIGEELSPARPRTEESRRPKTAAERDALPGRAWLEIGDTDIECAKATFGGFKWLRASICWAQPIQANMPLTNAEKINGCIAVVKREAPNLQEKLGSLAEKVDKCVSAGAVGVIIVNTGRGYELLAPDDPFGLSAAWPSDRQIPIVCVRDMDAATLQDGVDCSFERRSNSPALESSAPMLSVGSAVRFEGPKWEDLEEDEGDEEEEGQDSKSLSPIASALSRAGSQANVMMAKQTTVGVRALKRLSMNVRYKLMPTMGLSSSAMDAGMQAANVVDDNVAISPLNRHNQQTPGVFKRAPSNSLQRMASFSTSFGKISSAASKASAAIGIGAKASQTIRVAQDLVDDDGNTSGDSPGTGASRRSPTSSGSPPVTGGSRSSSKGKVPADPMERFKKKSQIGDGADFEALSAELDPGEQLVLRKSLAKRGLTSASTDQAEDAPSQESDACKASALRRRSSRKWRAEKKTEEHGQQAEGNTGGAAAAQPMAAEGETKKDVLKTGPSASAGGWSKLRSAVTMQDQPETENPESQKNTREKQGEGDEPEMSEEDQKKLKKIMAAFKKHRSADLIAAEKKQEAGEELNTREKLALFMAEKKLKKAISRVQSTASEQSASLSRAPSGAFSRVNSATFSRVSSSASAAALLASSAFSRIGSFSRTLSGGDPKDGNEAFQRAGGDAAGSRLDAKESAIEQVLPLLTSAVPAKDTAGTPVGRGDDERVHSGAALGEVGAALGNTDVKPRRPDSGRPSRITTGPSARAKKGTPVQDSSLAE